MSTDRHLTELGEAARRAGAIVTEHIDSIVANAELRADEIRQSGERDAEHARREAFDSASRVFERIQALERPLGELVHTLRFEMERVGRELEGEAYEEQPAISAEAESASLLFEEREGSAAGAAVPPAAVEEPAVEEVEEPSPAEPAVAGPAAPEPAPRTEFSCASCQSTNLAVNLSEGVYRCADCGFGGVLPSVAAEVAKEVEMPEWAREAVAAGGAEAEVPAEPAQPTMVSPLPQPAGEPQKKKKTKRRMFRRKGSTAKGAFIKTQGHCAVCQRTFMAGSEEAFKLSGWRANGEVGLCPDCQAQSWQLPDGARLPFRRGGA